VKTIVSVDGGKPDVETARKHGIRYVHLPIGYDATDCTAGLPPSPSCAKFAEGWSATKAETWMREAGTAADYLGLYSFAATNPNAAPMTSAEGRACFKPGTST
jgi:hypothetical protein